MKIALDNVRTEPVQADTTAQTDLGKDEFLQLFLAQLSQQDPLNPLDDKAFIAQLAQFTALEQAIQTNQHLEVLGLTQSAVINAQATDLLGREVIASGQELRIEGAPPDLQFNLGDAASEVSARILDSSGNLVRTVEIGALAEGDHAITWDGLSDAGQTLADGDYSIEISAKDSVGESVAADARVSGRVDGVTFESGSAELLVNGMKISPANVIEVTDDSSTTGSVP